jgi:hypothetical protein
MSVPESAEQPEETSRIVELVAAAVGLSVEEVEEDTLLFLSQLGDDELVERFET